MKSGDWTTANREIKRLEKGSKANQDAFSMDFTDKVKDDAVEFTPEAQAARVANENEFGIDFSERVKDDNVPLGGSTVADSLGGVGEGTPKAVPAAAPQGAGVPEANIKVENLGIKEPIGPDGQRANPNVQEPNVIRTQDVADDDFDTILKRAKSDTEAIKKFGTKANAISEGHKFSDGGNLPWQKLRGTDQVVDFIKRASFTLEPRINDAKGGKVLSDARVESAARELADTFNEDPALIFAEIKEAGAQANRMVAYMEAGTRIGNKMMQDTYDLFQKVRVGGDLSQFQGNADAANAEIRGRLTAAIDTLASVASIRASMGRGVRRGRSMFQVKEGDLMALKGSLDDNRLAIILEKSEGDPRKLVMAANRTFVQRVMSEANFHLTNGLLWLWPTHLINATTNLYMTASRPAEKYLGGTALKLITKDPVKRAELSTLTSQAKKELVYSMASVGDAWHTAVDAFMAGDSKLSPHNTEIFLGAGENSVAPQVIQWKDPQSIWDVLSNVYGALSYHNAVGAPTRVSGSMDEFFKQLRYRAVVQARAAVDADNLGLAGVDYKAYVQKAMDDSIDAETGRALNNQALLEAQTATFQRDLDYETTFGNFGRALLNARKTAPVFSLVLPFVKTPVNVIRYGLKLTPGLNFIQREFRDAMTGVNGTAAQAQAMGQLSLGSLFAVYASHLVSQGKFTGGGPEDYNAKQELMATGWRPYSYVEENEDGTVTYTQAGRFDPAAMVFGLVADIYAAKESDPDLDIGDMAGAVLMATAKNLSEKTFLLNLNTALQAAIEPEKKGAKFLGRTAGSMLPMSSLMRGLNPDPYLRDARSFVDNVIRGVPGLSNKLPKKYTWSGETIHTAVNLVHTQKSDVVESEHNRIILQTGQSIGKPDPQWEGIDLRDIPLKSGVTAYERFQELSGKLPNSKTLKETLEVIIRSDNYQDLPDGPASVDGTRSAALADIVRKYRATARKVLLRENPELQQYIKARQKTARGAFIENRKRRLQGDPGARSLLEALTPQ